METGLITARDVEFHTPANADHRHAETNWFCFYIPKEKLMAIVYTVARRGVGVQSCDVSLYGALVDNRAETLYLDSQMALPCPPKLSEYTTANGLSVKVVNAPRDYRVDYIGYDGMEIHVDFKGLMEPFDIHDPHHSPMAKATTEEQHAGAGMLLFSGGLGHRAVVGVMDVKGLHQAFEVDMNLHAVVADVIDPVIARRIHHLHRQAVGRGVLRQLGRAGQRHLAVQVQRLGPVVDQRAVQRHIARLHAHTAARHGVDDGHQLLFGDVEAEPVGLGVPVIGIGRGVKFDIASGDQSSLHRGCMAMQSRKAPFPRLSYLT